MIDWLATAGTVVCIIWFVGAVALFFWARGHSPNAMNDGDTLGHASPFSSVASCIFWPCIVPVLLYERLFDSVQGNRLLAIRRAVFFFALVVMSIVAYGISTGAYAAWAIVAHPLFNFSRWDDTQTVVVWVLDLVVRRALFAFMLARIALRLWAFGKAIPIQVTENTSRISEDFILSLHRVCNAIVAWIVVTAVWYITMALVLNVLL